MADCTTKSSTIKKVWDGDDVDAGWTGIYLDKFKFLIRVTLISAGEAGTSLYETSKDITGGSLTKTVCDGKGYDLPEYCDDHSQGHIEGSCGSNYESIAGWWTSSNTTGSTCMSGTTCSSAGCFPYYYKDKITKCKWNEVCGIPDTENVCTLGSTPGEIEDFKMAWYYKDDDSVKTLVAGGNWLPSDSQTNVGAAVRCTYTYDFEEENYDYNYRGNTGLSNIINDLFDPQAESQETIFDNNTPRIMGYTYATNWTWYNQLYSSNGSSKFQKEIDFFETNQKKVDDYRENMAEWILDKGSDDEIQKLTKMMLLPTVYEDNIEISFNRDQYVRIRDSANPDDELSILLGYLLRDRDVLWSSDGISVGTGTSEPELEIQSWKCYYVMLNEDTFTTAEIDPEELEGPIDECSNSVYDDEDYEDTNPNKFVAYYTATCTVKKWSVMLVSYIRRVFPDIEFNCEEVLKDTKLYLIDCWECGYGAPITEQCKSDIAQYCKGYLIPPSYIFGSYVWLSDLWLVKGNSADCGCYVTPGPAPVGQFATSDADMCFNTLCTSSQRWIDAYDLNNKDKCGSQCGTVQGWLYATDPGRQPANLDYLDIVKYGSFCGDTYIPYDTSTLNIDILAGLLVGAVLITVSVGLLTQGKVRIGVTVVTGLISIGVAIFLGIDLSGKPICEGTEYPATAKCVSRITNMYLPQSMCKFYAQCECQADSICNGCKCVSGTCFPFNTGGSRETRVQNCKYINFNLLIPLTASAITVPILFMAICSKIKKITPLYYVPISLILSISFVLPAILLGIERYNRTSYVPELCNPGTAASSSL